ncbi:ABC transporter substrate-binding protein [Roseomonas sp. BN140053]|uniref:ABC transporter substrate-binding protein n=1 Tax=Roseomonas sp. BN140053 TaxID=3391898 RepID=UPI0039E95E81
MPQPSSSTARLSRRNLIQASAGVAALGGAGFISVGAEAANPVVSLQLGWIAGGNQLGEIVAKQLGYFAAEGLDLRIQPGGPNNDGVAVVAAGRYEMGQLSSSPSLMLAASQDIPVQCFAVGAQQHPYAFFSLPRAPVRTPADLRGKKVGIQATGVILLRALLARNGMELKDVQVVTIGSEMTPLLTGQVDVVTGWVTNTTALKVLGPDRIELKLWDAGVRLYALPYYATAETIRTKGDVLARFLRAAGKGWAYAHAHRDEAVALLLKELPNLNAADEREAADVMLAAEFTPVTATQGWGSMDPAVWQEQIALYAQLGQFTKRTPALAEVMSMSVLDATRGQRPTLG